MAWPGGVRFHYGHPDLWNKLWIMTRGGMSKATMCVLRATRLLSTMCMSLCQVCRRHISWVHHRIVLCSHTIYMGHRASAKCHLGALAFRGLHISEDVFAGYNHTQRGAVIKFREYMSVGKGREMGFESINKFEAKVRTPFAWHAVLRVLLLTAARGHSRSALLDCVAFKACSIMVCTCSNAGRWQAAMVSRFFRVTCTAWALSLTSCA